MAGKKGIEMRTSRCERQRNKKGTIAENMRKFRKLRSLSQDKLAKMTGLSFPTIAKIESGKTANPSVYTLKRIADALGVGIEKLLEE